MEQKIPIVSEADIIRIINREFTIDTGWVFNILKNYESETIIGKNRIYADILKLSNGKIELLEGFVVKAIRDYRDIISLAEYPNYSKYAFEDELSKSEEKQIIKKDWQQFNEWFSKK